MHLYAFLKIIIFLVESSDEIQATVWGYILQWEPGMFIFSYSDEQT